MVCHVRNVPFGQVAVESSFEFLNRPYKSTPPRTIHPERSPLNRSTVCPLAPVGRAPMEQDANQFCCHKL